MVRTVNVGSSVLLLGESGSGKTTAIKSALEQLDGFNYALASYTGSIKLTLQEIANQLGYPITKEGAKGGTKELKVDELKEEILCRSDSTTLICFDNAERFPASLRYWMEFLFNRDVVMICSCIDDPRKEVFLKLIKIELSPPTDNQIREVMVREAISQSVELSPSKMAQLQARAGSNLMLAKRVVQEEALGLGTEAGEHTQYIDVSPFIYSLFAVFGIIRFIGLGMGNIALYAIGGILVFGGIAIKQFSRGINQKQRKLGK